MQPSSTTYELNPFDRPGEITILTPGRSTFWAEDYDTAEIFVQRLCAEGPIALGEHRPPLRFDFPPLEAP